MIIRNAVCTALHAFEHYEPSPRARQFVVFSPRLIPRYWEGPEPLAAVFRLNPVRLFLEVYPSPGESVTLEEVRIGFLSRTR